MRVLLVSHPITAAALAYLMDPCGGMIRRGDLIKIDDIEMQVIPHEPAFTDFDAPEIQEKLREFLISLPPSRSVAADDEEMIRAVKKWENRRGPKTDNQPFYMSMGKNRRQHR